MLGFVMVLPIFNMPQGETHGGAEVTHLQPMKSEFKSQLDFIWKSWWFAYHWSAVYSTEPSSALPTIRRNITDKVLGVM